MLSFAALASRAIDSVIHLSIAVIVFVVADFCGRGDAFLAYSCPSPKLAQFDASAAFSGV
jgi:hypothetical protein